MKMFHKNYTVFSVFKKSKHFFENFYLALSDIGIAAETLL